MVAKILADPISYLRRRDSAAAASAIARLFDLAADDEPDAEAESDGVA
jgi:hypothetical protein